MNFISKLEEKTHEVYQRHGKDLSTKVDISLQEALCGFKKVLKTLDNRNIIFSTNPGEVIKHGDIKMCEGEGFPKHKDPFQKGRLILVFNVIFPSSLSPEVANKIKAAFPKVKADQIPKDSEELKMVQFDGQGKWGGEDDEEEDQQQQQGRQGFGGAPPQCAQQ